MMTLESLALALNNGLTSGHILARDKKTYALWAFRCGDTDQTSHHIYYSFVKNVSQSLDKALALYPDCAVFEGFGRKWRTQAAYTMKINEARRNLRNAAAAEAQVMPFGKYQGQRIDEITDVDYLCWMANQHVASELGGWSNERPIADWVRSAARERALFLGALEIGGSYITRKSDNRFDVNTFAIHDAIEAGSQIEYVADKNNGGVWSAYSIILPTVTCGSMYYGAGECLLIEDRARRAKGMRIVITDYKVTGTMIEVKDFYAIR